MRLPVISLCLLGLAITGFAYCPCLAKSQEKTVAAADGALISGTYYGDKVPKMGLVLLLPMLGHTRSDYDRLVKSLGRAGFSVFAIDQRGHGKSTAVGNPQDKSLDYNKFSREDWEKLPGDILSVLKELNAGAPACIVGASIGANAAALAAPLAPSVKALVLLSPGSDYHGLEPGETLAKTKIPVMIVVSRKDDYSYESSKKFAAANTGKITLESYNDAGHGTDMFKTQKVLPGKIADWLKAQVKRKQ